MSTEIELQYNRARYYDAGTGRWISQDPLGFDAGDSNLYRYAKNRYPVTVDPSGLSPTIIPPPTAQDTLNTQLNIFNSAFNTLNSFFVDLERKIDNAMELNIGLLLRTGMLQTQAQMYADDAFLFLHRGQFLNVVFRAKTLQDDIKANGFLLLQLRMFDIFNERKQFIQDPIAYLAAGRHIQFRNDVFTPSFNQRKTELVDLRAKYEKILSYYQSILDQMKKAFDPLKPLPKMLPEAEEVALPISGPLVL